MKNPVFTGAAVAIITPMYEEIIKQTFTKNAGQHKTFLLVLTACRGGFQPARRLLLLPDDIFFSFPGNFLSFSLPWNSFSIHPKLALSIGECQMFIQIA